MKKLKEEIKKGEKDLGTFSCEVGEISWEKMKICRYVIYSLLCINILKSLFSQTLYSSYTLIISFSTLNLISLTVLYALSHYLHSLKKTNTRLTPNHLYYIRLSQYILILLSILASTPSGFFTSDQDIHYLAGVLTLAFPFLICKTKTHYIVFFLAHFFYSLTLTLLHSYFSQFHIYTILQKQFYELLTLFMTFFAIISFQSERNRNSLLKQLMKEEININQEFRKLEIPIIFYSKEGVDFLSKGCSAPNFQITKNNFLQKSKSLISKDGKSLDQYLRDLLYCNNLSHFTDFDNLDKKIFNSEEEKELKRVIQVSLVKSVMGKKELIVISLCDITESIKSEGQPSDEKFKNMLLCSLSHELQTPLNGIIGPLSELKQTSTPETKPLLKIALISSLMLSSKISDILDYNSMLFGEFCTKLSKASPNKLLKKITKLFKYQIKTKDLKLTYSIDNSIENEIKMDAERMSQVLINLVSNSIKFTEKGSITMAMEEEAEKNSIRIKVTDTGIGMSQKQCRSLFKIENSQSLNETRTGRASGLAGMGLTISQMLCSQMGNELIVFSLPNKGSTFSFSIPYENHNRLKLELTQIIPSTPPLDYNFKESLITESNTPQNEREAAGRLFKIQKVAYRSPPSLFDLSNQREFDATSDLSNSFIIPTEKSPFFSAKLRKKNMLRKSLNHETERMHVLVCDDNEINRFVARTILNKKLNIRISEGVNGKEAVNLTRNELVRGKRILILMDLEMPVMDGITACKEIRKLGTQYQPAIIALSAYSSQTEIDKCIQGGMDAFISKPITIQKMDLALSYIQNT